MTACKGVSRRGQRSPILQAAPGPRGGGPLGDMAEETLSERSAGHSPIADSPYKHDAHKAIYYKVLMLLTDGFIGGGFWVVQVQLTIAV